MKPQHVDHLLSEYIDGALSPGFVEKVKTHLIFCSACRAHLQDLEANIAECKKVTTPRIPNNVEKKITKAMMEPALTAEELVEDRKSHSPFNWVPVLRGAAVLATCLFVFVVVKNLGDTEQPTPSEIPVIAQNPVKEEPAKSLLKANDSKPEPLAPIQTAPSRPDPNIQLAGGNKKVEAAPLGLKPVRKAQNLASQSSFIPPKTDEKTDANNSLSDIFTEKHGFQNSSKLSGERLISNQDEWTKIWSQINNLPEDTSNIPPVDFDKNTVIAIFAEPQPSAGFKVSIQNIEESRWEGKTSRIINYQVLSPPSDTLAAAVITYPYLLKVLPKISGPTNFKKIAN